MPNITTFKPDGHILVFGEINLDIYVEIQAEGNYANGSVVPSTVNVKTGGNTWNIARMLALLGRSITFVCTSNRYDVPSSILLTEKIPPKLELIYIPNLGTVAPRFVAVDKGAEAKLRTVFIPKQHKPTHEQLAFVSTMIKKGFDIGVQIAVLASSIEPQLLAHIICECRGLSIHTIGTVSSAPSVRQYDSHLQNLSMLVLNSSEVRIMLDHLTLKVTDEDFARTLAECTNEVVLTCGAIGSISCSHGGETIKCKALDLSSTLVNDLGAGDTFAAFLIDSYLRQGGKIDRNALAWATAGAAMVCQTSEHILSYVDMPAFHEIFELVLQNNNERTLP